MTRTSLAVCKFQMVLLLIDNASRQASRQSKFQVSNLEARSVARTVFAA
jgi:hypothetical protein